MAGINKAIILGNVGNEPDIRVTQAGKCVASFSIATSENWKDQQGNKQEKTTWHNIVAFDRLAEVIRDYVKKGSKVYVEGKHQVDEYEKNGEKRYSSKVVIRELQMLDSKQDNQQTNYDKRQESIKPKIDDDFDDSVPF